MNRAGRSTVLVLHAHYSTPLTTTYTWDADSRLTTKTLPNGITVTHTYDAASRLTRLVYRNSANQILEDISYSYDAAGQRTARSSTNTLGSRDVPHQASYDANNRLTSLTLNPGTAQAKTYTLSYNANNRLTSLTLNPGTAQAKTYTLSYNATGSLISKVNTADASDTSTYTWDSQQRLTQVQTPELTASYRYDLLGRRVQRQITKPGQPPETTHYVYDGLQAVAEIRPQQSSTSFLTGLNLDEMLARVTTLNGNTPNTTQTRTYLTDALGSVIAQTQDNQSTLAGYSYSPYGNTQSTGNTEGDSVQYTAREHDANGLYYYRARYYDPVLKRFISEDPIGLQGGSLSFYAYVNGDPVSYVDPEGKKPNPGSRGGGRYGSPFGPGGRNENGGKLPPIEPFSPRTRDLDRRLQEIPEAACDYNPALCVPKTACVKWFCERKKNNDTPYQCRPPLDYSFEYPSKEPIMLPSDWTPKGCKCLQYGVIN